MRTERDPLSETHHWMFPLQANHLQHIYLILCSEVDCKEAQLLIKKLFETLCSLEHRTTDKFAEYNTNIYI
jgi:hypothetical protein